MAFMPAFALHRDDQADDESDAERGGRPVGDARDFVADDLERAAGQHAGEAVELTRNRARVGEQSVHGHDRGDGRKDREQGVEGDSGSDGEDAVPADVLINMHQHVAPGVWARGDRGEVRFDGLSGG
jgi:hypothetical protein